MSLRIGRPCPVLNADVDVGAEDEHLVAPQLGAVHQRMQRLNITLHQRVGEGVVPPRQVHAQGIGDGKNAVEGEGDATMHWPTRQLPETSSMVLHHLAVHVRVRAHLLRSLGALAQSRLSRSMRASSHSTLNVRRVCQRRGGTSERSAERR